MDEYKAAYEELSQVQHVLVVGGGTTAVEWAAEVKSAFPDKQVPVVKPNRPFWGAVILYRKPIFPGGLYGVG